MKMNLQACAKLLALGCVAVFATTANAAVNLVVNGGFETGSFTGWTVTGTQNFSSGVIAGDAHSGTYSAFFGPPNDSNDPASGTLTQSIDLATTPGQTYEFSFWLKTSIAFPNTFEAKFAGTTYFGPVNIPSTSSYVQHTYQVVATGFTSSLEFDITIENSGATGGFLLLDDVSVTALPEAASFAVWSLLGSSGLVVAVARSRRKHQIV